MQARVTLHQFPRPKGLANLSPFCIKAELFMRMASIPYDIRETLNPRQAPKGKLPYITHEGKNIPDSNHILEYLTSVFSVHLDDNLDEEQLAIGHAVKVMLEDHLRWCIVYSRWLDESCWPYFRKISLGLIPWPAKAIYPIVSRRRKQRISETLKSNGIGRFPPEEVYQFGKDDIASLASILSKRTYLLGDQPSSFDASVYAFIANLIDVPIPCSLNHMTQENEILQKYHKMMKQTYFSDLSI